MSKSKTKVVVIAVTVALGILVGSMALHQIVGEPVEGFATGLPEAPILVGNTTHETQAVSGLSEEEKVRAVQIIETDAHVGGILQNASWHIKLVGLWTGGQQEAGAVVLITFEGAVWIRDTFYNALSGESYVGELWAGSMHIYVDLEHGRVVGLSPTVGRAPIASSEHAVAAQIALSHPLGKGLGENAEVYLTAVYYTGDYPGGLAFFSLRSDKGEAIVAVDLEKEAVVEEYTSPVIRLEG